MKAYTDLEQSKKLAEFLSLESADMFWLVKLVYQEYPGGPLVRQIDDEQLEKLRETIEK